MFDGMTPTEQFSVSFLFAKQADETLVCSFREIIILRKIGNPTGDTPMLNRLMQEKIKNQSHCHFPSKQPTKVSSVADPDPGSGIGCFLTSGSGIRDPE